MPEPREIVLDIRSRSDSTHGFIAKIESWSKVLSLAAIPVVLGIVGHFVHRSLQNEQLKRDYVQMAVSILGNRESDLSLREWAVRVIDQYSPVKFAEVAPGLRENLKSGEVGFEVLGMGVPIGTVHVTTSLGNGATLTWAQPHSPDREIAFSQLSPTSMQLPHGEYIFRSYRNGSRTGELRQWVLVDDVHAAIAEQ